MIESRIHGLSTVFEKKSENYACVFVVTEEQQCEKDGGVHTAGRYVIRNVLREEFIRSKRKTTEI